MNIQQKRARGRPRTFDRRQALAAAMVLFWRDGYEGTSIAQLTEAMGINAPSLYAAFESKQKLYGEVLALYVAEHGDAIGKPLAGAGSARDAVARMLAEAARLFARAELPRGCMVATGVLRCTEAHRASADRTTALRRNARDAIRLRIERAVTEGEMPAGTDAAGLAAFYAATIQGMSVQAIDGASRQQLARIAILAMAAWP